MKQKKMLSLNLSQLRQLYRQEFPELISIAEICSNEADFKARMSEYVSLRSKAENRQNKQIQLLINYDGKTVTELSTGEELPINTLSLLWKFLANGRENQELPTDLFLDLFFQLRRLERSDTPRLSVDKVKRLMDKWDTGLDEEVMQIRTQNKERMIELLVKKLEQRKAAHSRYHFSENLSKEEKLKLVANWWNDYRFQLAMAIKSPAELNKLLNNSLPAETMRMLGEARKKGIPFFATPYYLSLLNVQIEGGYNDECVRRYIVYSQDIVDT